MFISDMMNYPSASDKLSNKYTFFVPISGMPSAPELLREKIQMIFTKRSGVYVDRSDI